MGSDRFPVDFGLDGETRIAITGGPKVGKTTLADEFRQSHRVRGTDEIKGMEWSEASEETSKWFDEDRGEPLLVEGVVVPRALRKWLRRNEDNRDRPVDVP